MVYSYLDHPSDVYVHVVADSLEGIFEEAAKATFDVMIDVASVEDKEVIDIELDGIDLEQLLYKWIDHLLFLFDAKSFVISKAKVEKIEKINDKYVIKSKVFGEEYNPKKHGHKTGVKAMTYSLMKIVKNEKWEAFFVLDI
ncbi:MAG: archease [Candidatus Methanomethylicia archaeon]|jgi:SHS2 domain-containing protein|uniref:Protein archease n=1 Tax=Thermoproteota archaeon TaxID=2056631 RepID=A0A523BBR9_9CREN|nr:archease [Candidatus Methanomethylicia archaeon]MCQ5340266.1 archease [Candidatus Methanomethylicia archaeon]RZN55382.1 MAG: archease [Candidatus Verstraetearchaeota archaeon]TDA38383.1 MAG: archease [Candidatus Verstraetearchaeota archaeon]